MPASSPTLIPVPCSICHAKPTAKPMKFLLSNAAQTPMMMTRSAMQMLKLTGSPTHSILSLTCSMASPLNNRCFYGANTTNEWVVREYIKDKENNPTIYNGLPLHTEYRVFVDFDTKEILGASPYWRSDVMKNEFKKVSSPQERHDYVVYKMHEDILNQRYHESVQTVLAELKKVIPRIELTGQWSVDVMRNGNDYYIIDMALAENSALNDCVPKNLFRAYPQQWLPGESNS